MGGHWNCDAGALVHCLAPGGTGMPLGSQGIGAGKAHGGQERYRGLRGERQGHALARAAGAAPLRPGDRVPAAPAANRNGREAAPATARPGVSRRWRS